MAVQAGQIFTEFLYDVAEDAGLVLGVVTQSQFIDLLNLVVLDFCKRSGLIQRIYTQTVFNGQGTYNFPDDLMEIRSVWLAGRWLSPSTQQQLNNTIRNWRTTPGMPLFYYTDGIAKKSLGLAPTPNYSGEFIIGPNNPDPPFSVYDSFSALCQVGSSQTTLSAAQHRGLTIIATRKPNTQIASLTDPIPLIPDDIALACLAFGVQDRIYSGDNELKDSQRALFCHAQFEESINLCRAISGEPGDDEA